MHVSCLNLDGTVSVFVGSSALGQGLETIFAQIAADALELTMDNIRGVFHGSTTFVSEGFGSFASRSTVMGGSAILAAAANLKKVIAEVAARRFLCEPSDIRFDGATVGGLGGSALTFTELAAEALSAEGSFENKKRTYSYGTHAAHVAVDARTGKVEILNYVSVEDVGRIINPETLHGQAVGAIVQGLGGVFLESLIYDDQGQLLTASLADYLTPSATDFPTIKAIALEMYPSPLNPLGAKGAGEGGIIPVAGLMANAIASALSSFKINPRDLPLSPMRVWQLIEERREARAADVS